MDLQYFNKAGTGFQIERTDDTAYVVPLAARPLMSQVMVGVGRPCAEQ